MKHKKKISIIDYKLSNLESMKNSLLYLNYDANITNDSSEILNSDGLILPGVGSFPDAIKYIKKNKLDKIIKEFIITKKPFLGVCLGFQMMFNYSKEFEYTEGLNILDGNTENFRDSLSIKKIPHIGWNSLQFNYQNKEALDTLEPLINQKNYYFIHSFYVKPKKNNIILSYTNYMDLKFCSSIKYENIIGVQFHPEKSGLIGLKFLKNLFG